MDISDLIRPLTLRVGAGCAVVVAALRGCLPWQSLPPCPVSLPENAL